MRIAARTSRWLVIAALCTPVALTAVDDPTDRPLPPGRVGVSPPVPVQDSMITPAYPVEALESGGEATVILGLVVDEDGRVSEVTPMRTDRPKLGFEEAAANAVGLWRFRPAELEGRPVTVYHFVKVRFLEPENREALLSLRPPNLVQSFASTPRSLMFPFGLPDAAGLGRSSVAGIADPGEMTGPKTPAPCLERQSCVHGVPGAVEIRKGGGRTSPEKDSPAGQR